MVLGEVHEGRDFELHSIHATLCQGMAGNLHDHGVRPRCQLVSTETRQCVGFWCREACLQRTARTAVSDGSHERGARPLGTENMR